MQTLMDTLRAEVVELVDTQGSGPCGGNTVGVRVPSSAPFFKRPVTLISCRLFLFLVAYRLRIVASEQ